MAFPEALRELAIELTSVIEDTSMQFLYDHLPPLLTVLKFTSSYEHGIREDFGEESDLSHNALTTGDLEALWPFLRVNLSALRLASNKLTSIPTPFPPLLRVLDVPFNGTLFNNVHTASIWIDALSSTMRFLNVERCCPPANAVQLLNAARTRAEFRCLSLAARLVIEATRIAQ
ncbi:hypothetical protein GGF32_005702 [Allomyces javanicus]|nr:hypothetical protein GGF32_005702 [Allomyces javanicus]